MTDLRLTLYMQDVSVPFLTLLDQLFVLLKRFYCYSFVFYVTGVSACNRVLGTITHSMCICHLAIKLYCIVLVIVTTQCKGKVDNNTV